MEVNTLYDRQHNSHLGTSKTVDLLEMVFTQNIPSLTDCMICDIVLCSGENQTIGTTKMFTLVFESEKYEFLGFKFRKLESLLIGAF